MLSDGTMANEVALCHTLLQWPYLTDMTLLSAVISIFSPGWCGAPSALIDTLLLNETPWFYFNLLMTDSQVFVPIISTHCDAKTALAAVTASAAYSARTGASPAKGSASRSASGAVSQGRPPLPPAAPEQAARSRSARHAQGSESAAAAAAANDATKTHESVLLCWSALREVFLKSAPLDAEGPNQLEATGLALTFGAFRFGYFFGGDGKSKMCCDLRNAAGFARSAAAVMTNFLLPIKTLSFTVASDVPRVSEGLILQKYILHARKVASGIRAVFRRLRKAKKVLLACAPQKMDSLPERGGSSPRLDSFSTNLMLPKGSRQALLLTTEDSTVSQGSARQHRKEKMVSGYDLLMEDAWSILSELMKVGAWLSGGGADHEGLCQGGPQ